MQFVLVHIAFENTPEECERSSLLSVARGEACHVDWSESSFSWLWLSKLASKEAGWVPASHVRPLYATLEEVLLRQRSGSNLEEEEEEAKEQRQRIVDDEVTRALWWPTL